MSTAPRKAKDVLLGQAKLPERTVAVYLRGDLVGQVEELERERAQLAGWSQQNLGDVDPTLAITAKIEKIRRQMADSRVVFTLRALPRKAWSDLITAHPSTDPLLRFDPATFFPALVHLSCVDPQFDTVDEVNDFFDQISQGQRQSVEDCSWQVNAGTVDVPFSDSDYAQILASAPKL